MVRESRMFEREFLGVVYFNVDIKLKGGGRIVGSGGRCYRGY